MPNKRVRAAAEGMPMEDPTLMIWETIRTSRAMQDVFDEGEYRSDDPSVERFCKDQGLHNYDRILSLKDVLSTMEAATLYGAATQAHEAICRLSLIEDAFPEDMETFAIKQDFRAADRLLWSILLLLVEEAPGAKADTLLTEGLGRNPFDTDIEQMRVEAAAADEKRLAYVASRASKKGGAK